MATQGVEFMEQPMPADMLEETRRVHERAKLPLIADESVLTPADIPKLGGVFDGINIKLMKAGRLTHWKNGRAERDRTADLFRVNSENADGEKPQ